MLFLHFGIAIMQFAMLLSAGKCRQPCRNGGKCTGRNKCKCSKGYHGDLCSKGEIISTWQKNCGHVWSKAHVPLQHCSMRFAHAQNTHCKNEPPVLDCTLKISTWAAGSLNGTWYSSKTKHCVSVYGWKCMCIRVCSCLRAQLWSTRELCGAQQVPVQGRLAWTSLQ